MKSLNKKLCVSNLFVDLSKFFGLLRFTGPQICHFLFFFQKKTVPSMVDAVVQCVHEVDFAAHGEPSLGWGPSFGSTL